MKKFLNILAVGFVMAGAIVGASGFVKNSTHESSIQHQKQKQTKQLNDENNGVNKNGTLNSDDNPFVKKSENQRLIFDKSEMFQARNGTIYAKSVGSGVYQSTDGITFTKNKSLENLYAGFIGREMFQARNGTIYIYGQDTSSSDRDGCFLYQSTDGITFTKNKSWKISKTIVDMKEGRNGIIYALARTTDSENEFYQSTDGIAFTNKGGLDIDDNSDCSLFIAWNGYIYLNFINKDYLSTDDGLSFHDFQNGNTLDLHDFLQARNGTIYAIGDFFLYQSTDGITFTKNKVNFSENMPNLDFINFFQARNGNIYVVAEWEASDAGLFYTSLFESSDGRTFDEINSCRDPDYSVSKFDNRILETQNGTIYFFNVTNVYQSTDGITFTKNKSLVDEVFFQACNGNIYTENHTGVKCIFLNNSLVNVKFKNNIFITNNNYVTTQNPITLDIKSEYISSASLGGQSITVPNVKTLENGKHELDLKFKNQEIADEYHTLFGGTGLDVTFKYWVKININLDDIQFQTESDNNLYSGLISNQGNTDEWKLIQTSAKERNHNANLIFSDSSTAIDWRHSFYEKGDIDKNNNFVANKETKNITMQFKFMEDGIYHLHLEDYVGNSYDAILELGKDNWKAKGEFSDADLKKKSSLLNVVENLKNPTTQIKSQFSGWLDNYQGFVTKQITDNFKYAVAKDGQGFSLSELLGKILNNQVNYLNRITYSDPKNPPKYSVKNAFMVSDIISKVKNAVQNAINDGVNKIKNLSQKLHISGQNNIVSKNDLGEYTSFVEGYEHYIDNNFGIWVNSAISKVSHGYLTRDQQKTVSAHFSNIDQFDEFYLNNVNWNSGLSNKYENYVNFSKFNSTVNNYIQNQFDTDGLLKKDITKAEDGVNYHGYSVGDVLKYGHKALPTDKQEIDNFDGKGDSFHVWLQNEANMLYHNNRNGQTMKTVLISVFSGIGGILLIAFLVWVLKNRFAKVGNYEKNKAWLKAENKKLKPGETPWIDAFADDDGSIKN